MFFCFFFFNDTATTEIYTLSLHDALPICNPRVGRCHSPDASIGARRAPSHATRSEEHTSELQSLTNLVCRLLLEKKKKQRKTHTRYTTITPHTNNNIHNNQTVSLPVDECN